jgi:glycosyltransferase involved in cell wall biosynthesis
MTSPSGPTATDKQTPPDLARRTVVVSANSAWALTNYRMNLLKALQEKGFSVVALVPPGKGASKLIEAGLDVHAVRISAHGMSPLQELRLLARYVLLLRRLRPAAFLGFTIKPNIYGGLAGAVCGVPVINNVTGLGLAFSGKGPLRWIALSLYRLALRRSRRVFFQNRESLELFMSLGLVRDGQVGLLPGSGIDLKRFAPPPAEGEFGRPFTFLLASRLLWQKGIAEYCAAARWFRANRPGVTFQLIGNGDCSSKGAVPKEQIEKWQQEGLIDYLGSTDDVRPYFASADCIVLPSYYPEGVPRSLIEAAAMGRPIITTDTPGCREVVIPGESGFLCEPRSSRSLVERMLQMIDRSESERQEMGKLAREKAEQQFDERRVISAYLTELDAIVK